jgi:hypothetical protein
MGVRRMSLSWVNGTVGSVLTDLRKSYESSTSGDTGIVYAAAVGMVTGLSGPHDKRPIEERMADIVTVCAAVRRFEDEESDK